MKPFFLLLPWALSSSFAFSQSSGEAKLIALEQIEGIKGLKPSPTESGNAQISYVVFTDFDAKSFPFLWYMQLVQNKIASKWKSASLPNGFIKIAFSVYQDGSIRELRPIVYKNSRNEFEITALHAIRSVDPLPPLPKGYTGSSIQVSAFFVIAKQVTSTL